MPVDCWNCGAALPQADAPGTVKFCPGCNALQPPPRDYFAFFEIPRELNTDMQDLERRFYRLSRKLHPDLFSRKSAREREYSLESTAILNDAYRTLWDPILRAQYVLKEEGFEIGEQGTKDVPPELLEEVFDLNMALEELRTGDDEAREQIHAARNRFEGMRGEIDGELDRAFRHWDNGHSAEVLAAIRGLLNRRKYITNLIAQTESA